MSTVAVYSWLARQMRRHIGGLCLAGGQIAMITALELLKPWPLKIVIDNVLGRVALPSRLGPRILGLAHAGWLLPAACLAQIGIYLLLALLQLANTHSTVAIGQRMVADLRARLFDHLTCLSWRFHRNRSLADLMVRVASDSYGVQALAMNGIFPAAASLLLLAAMLAAMARIDMVLALAALAVLPTLALAILALGPRIERSALAARMAEGTIYDAAHRELEALELIQAYGAERQARRRWRLASALNLRRNLNLYLMQTLYGGMVSVLLAAGAACVIYLGARHVIQGRLSVGDLVVFVAYLVSMYAPLSHLFQTYGASQSALASLRRCLELLAEPIEIADSPGALTLTRPRGAIRIERLRFSYPGAAPLLAEVSLTAAPGATLAIVGPSGAGKTTLAGLIARFDEPTGGVIEFDGHRLQSLKIGSLRQAIAIVPQRPMLLAGSLRANLILGGTTASRGRIERVVRAFGLEPVIARLGGIEARVGQGGQPLSLGEIQRIALARAMLKEAALMVLDEPTSALDAESEARLLIAMRTLAPERTVILISHRLSAARIADRIALLRGGRIEEDGSFDQLVARGGYFSYLYKLQNGASTHGASEFDAPRSVIGR
jgi:ATP-binding cassette subfamily B protein